MTCDVSCFHWRRPCSPCRSSPPARPSRRPMLLKPVRPTSVRSNSPAAAMPPRQGRPWTRSTPCAAPATTRRRTRWAASRRSTT
ncbi:MAG: hypothetical protein C3F10_04745 [Dehalococcoidia bacterium]|nr:MAG: hypothetical protein C3F10_04745 [Dehalococcoidia bacterium]